MESDSGFVSAEDAVTRLQQHDSVRARAERSGPSRGYAWLLILSALVLSVYVGVFLFAFYGFDPYTGTGGYSYTNLLVLPILLFSALVNGARERFSIRKKPSIAQWIAYLVTFAAFMILAGLSVAGVSYPRWLNLLVAGALFAAIAVAPIRQLVSAHATTRSEPWVNERLSVPVRWTTASIGVVVGVLAAASASTWFPIASSAIMLGSLIVALVGWRARWGLPRTGYEWEPVHWVVFGIAITLTFTLTALLTASTSTPIWLPLAVGASAFALMLTASLLPLRFRQG